METFPSGADHKATILRLEEERQRALLAVDIPALDAMFADDLVHVHSTGLVHTKAGLLEHIERKRGFLGFRRGLLTVTLNGSCAVVTGTIENHMRGRDGGADVVMPGFVTQVLRYESDRWKFTNFQFTIMQESGTA